MNKKILGVGIIVLLVVMLLILTGCGDTNKSGNIVQENNTQQDSNRTYESDNWESYYDEKKQAYGFKDENNNIVIEAKYKEVENFENGFAIVSRDLESTDSYYDSEWRYAYYGLINEEGEEVVPCKYKYMSYDEDEGLYLVNEDNGTVISGNLYYINEKDEKVKEW